MTNTTYDTKIEKDSYVTRILYWKVGDDTAFKVAYSYNEHKRQKLYRAINRRLRGWG